MDFRLLGALEVESDGRLLRLRGGKERALLAALLLHANEPVSREQLVEALWTGRPPRSATHSLEVYISRLRKALGADGAALESQPDGYRLRIEPDQLDLCRFEQLVAEGWQALAAGDPWLADERLRRALSLWRGTPFLELAGEPAAELEAERLEELRLSALEGQIDAQLALGRQAELVGRLRLLVAGHPLREALQRRLMLALYRCGRQAEALDVYQQARRRLVEVLGIEPGPELKALQQAILRQDTALDLPATDGSQAEPLRIPPPPARPPPRQERKVVTVLVYELDGSAVQAERMDPEDLEALFSSRHGYVQAGLERFGGTVETSIGDAAVAFFGAPLTHEDDPERAVRAALAIRSWARGHGGDLQARVGVKTGEALVRIDTDPAAGEAMVAGGIVGAAVRLQAAAPANGVLVDEPTYRATCAAIDYEKAEPRAVWEALAARPRATIETLPQTPFVGRREELDLLGGALQRARHECEPQLVTVAGVPGIGKSRLVAELAAAVDAGRETIRWRRGRSLPYGENVSLWALGEIVKAELGVGESDSRDKLAAKLARSLGELVEDAAERDWIAAQLRPLVGLSGGGVARDRSQSAAARRRWLELLAGRAPLVLVFEDIQWADDELLDFIDHLVVWSSGVPLLVVCTTRLELYERRPGWGGGKRNALTISLGPLGDADTERVLAAALEERALPSEARDELLRRAGGNPLYAEQFARMVAERATPDVLPETVQGIVAARLDLLSVEEKSLLQDASVIGGVFWPSAIGADDERLHALERKEFIRRDPRGGGEYAFAHALVRDVAYAQLPRAARAERHRRAAEWLASLPADRAAGRVELLAHHYEAALDLGRAAGLDVGALVEPARRAFADAAQRALALNALPAAERYYTAALELRPPDDPERATLLLGRAEARLFVGGDAVGDAEAALTLLPEDDEGAVEAEMMLARSWWLRRDGEQAALHAERALQRTATLPPSRVKAAVLTDCARLSLLEGDLERAIALSTEGLVLAETLGLASQQASALVTRGSARRDPAGRDDLRRGVEIAESAEDLEQLLRGLNNLAVRAFWLAGDAGRAQELYRRMRDLAQRHGARARLAPIDAQEALLLLRIGAWDDAVVRARSIVVAAAADESYDDGGTAYPIQAYVRHARGEPGARAFGERGVACARRGANVWELASALGWQARLLAFDGDLRSARRLLDELIGLYASHTAVVHAWSPEIVWAFARVGEPGEYRALLERERRPAAPWLEAALATCERDFGKAAEIYGGLGARTAEAEARVHAARVLLGGGDPAAAAAQVARAIAFYRSVRASRLIRDAEQVVPGTS